MRWKTHCSALQLLHTVSLWFSCTYASACARSCNARFLLSSMPADAGNFLISLVMASGVARLPTCL